MNRRCRFVLAVGAAMWAVVGLTAVLAGDYHKGDGLHCADCHVMHGSNNGTAYGGTLTNPTGYSSLLKSSSTNTLCLQCHDGTDTAAPDVVASGTAAAPTTTLGIAYSSVYKNSAGYFQSDWGSAASPQAHDLYSAGALTAIQGTWQSSSTGMKCSNCHDPHGTTNYRNLKLRPGTAAANVQISAGTSGTQQVYLREAITVPATASSTATHYDTSAVAFNDPNSISTWCEGCHTNIESGAKHPQNQEVSGAPGYADAAWVAGTGVGFGTAIDDSTSGSGTAGIPRIRFAQAGTSYSACSTPADTNKVMCLSCHKAHGSKYEAALVWPYTATGAKDQTSACDQCHAKGA